MGFVKREDTPWDDIQYILHISEAYAREYLNATLAPLYLLKAILLKAINVIPFLVSFNKEYCLLDWTDIRIRLLDYQRKYQFTKSTPILLLASIATSSICFLYGELKYFPIKSEEILSTWEQTTNKCGRSHPVFGLELYKLKQVES